MATIAKPKALAIPSRLIAPGPEPMLPMTAAPQPKNTRAKVPTNSASCLFIPHSLPNHADLKRRRVIATALRAEQRRKSLGPVRPCVRRCFHEAGGYISDDFRVTPDET